MSELISLPLSEEIFNELDTVTPEELADKYIVDASQINFEDDVDENIESTFIYFRNLQLKFKVDFSKLSYKDKCKWIEKALTIDITNAFIPQLDDTIVTILANEYIELDSILDGDEVDMFRKDHPEIIQELLTFLVSLDSVIVILSENCGNDKLEYDADSLGVQVISHTPNYFGNILRLLNNYPIQLDAIRLYNHEGVTPVLYSCIIDSINKGYDLYQALLKLPTIKFMGLVSKD